MADKPLKSIIFPGLADKYMIPQIDSTLTQQGEAADAKKTGDEISDVRNTLNHKADVIYDTASGDIASFPDGADGLPVKDLIVGIEPMQDLHGYENPWPAGGGKNLLNPATLRSGDYNGSSLRTRVSQNIEDRVVIENGKTYTVSVTITDKVNGLWVVLTNSENSIVELVALNVQTAVTVTGTSERAGLYLTLVFGGPPVGSDWADITVADVIAANPQIEINSTATSFAPYSNICPISGWTGMNVSATGINLVDKSAIVQGSISGTGQDTTSTSRVRTGFIKIKPSTNYAISIDSGVLIFELHFYDKNKNWLSYVAINATSSVNQTRADSEYVKIIIRKKDNSNITPSGVEWIQFEENSAVTLYKPFGTTLPISWQSTAGTVFAGYIGVVSGVLVSEWKKVKIGDLEWTTQGGNYGRFISIIADGVYDNNLVLCRSDIYKGYSNESKPAYATGVYIGMGDDPNVKVYDAEYPTAEDLDSWKAARANNEILYKLATPLVYQLDSHTIKTLLGQNNIWADTGNSTVEYPADTKLYIDKKLAALVAALS